MKLLHVTPAYLPNTRFGGPIHCVHGLCKALVARGHEVSVATTSVDGPQDSEVPHGVPVPLDGVKVHYYRSRFLRRLYFSTDLSRGLARLIADRDLVHSHCIFQQPSVAAARAAFAARKPYVLQPHGMLIPSLIEMKSPLVKKNWIRLFERRNLAGADATVFTTALEQAEFAKLGLATRRQWIVANGVDVAAEPMPKPEVPNEILFIGRVNWKKGIDRLIRALAAVPGATLTVAGNDEDHYQPSLEALASEVGVAGRVRFVGFADESRKHELLRRATLFVLPSHSENFGLVVAEAWAVGRPVLITPEVGLADAVRACDGGAVAAGDPEPLAQALRELLAAPDATHEKGLRGWRHAVEHFGWPAIARQMEARYRSLGVAA